MRMKKWHCLPMILAGSCLGQGIVTTFAGNDAIFTDDGKPAVNAALVAPAGLAIDTAGNLFVAAPRLNMVLKVDTNGMVSIVAGNGLGRFAGDGGPARAASLSFPSAVAVDGSGNVFILDAINGRVRRVGPNGIISTVAGGGNANPVSAEGGLATKADFELQPPGGGGANGIAVDAAGNLYIADRYHNRIWKVNAAGIISTYAGNGQTGITGDGGPAVSAGIPQPTGIRFSAGNLYIAEAFGPIRRVSAAGIITTISASIATGLATDAAGSVYIANQLGERVQKIVGGSVIPVAGNGKSEFSGDGGAASTAGLSSPSDVVLDSNGNIYVADRDNDRIRRIDPNGIISTIAGQGSSVGDGGPATSARLDNPSQMTMDAAGNLYVADSVNHRIRKITPSGVISTFAGNGSVGFSGNGGPATNASLNTPTDIKMDAGGNFYIADAYNSLVRKVDTKGIITTFAGGGNSRANNIPANTANLGYCDTIAVDGAGNVYVVSVDAATIYKITPAGVLSAVAGNGTRSYSGDGGPATAASFSGNTGAMLFDLAGNLYFTDAGNNRVRKVDSKGIITTFAGNGNYLNLNSDGSLKGDGLPAAQAALSNPTGLAQDKSGNIYVVTQAGLIWLVKPDGTIHSFAGAFPRTAATFDDLIGFSGDGGPASAARFGTPQGAVLDAAGNLYVSDSLNRRIRLIQSGPSPSIVASQKGLTFAASTGGGAPASQRFTIVNGGEGTLNWGLTVSTASGGNWLSVTPAGGTSTAGNAGPLVQVGVNPAGLAAGDYYGQIQIQAAGAPNSPQSVTVVLSVRAASAGTGSIVQPSGLLFTAVPGGTAPASQSFTLTTLSTSPVSFTGTASFGGPSWFTVTSASGTTVSGKPAAVQIVPAITGLAAGVYNGNITFAFSDNSVQSVQLLLVLSAGGGNRPNAPGGRAAGCAPSKLLLLFTSLGSGFSITTGWPSPVELLVVDDCGQALTRGSVTASFSNADPALALNSLGDGRWTGTWQAQNAASSVSVTASAQSADKSLSGSSQVSGGLNKNANPPPAVAAGGVLNAASYQLRGSLAPGSLVSIFGSLLSASDAPAAGLPLTTTLAGTIVTIAGRALPLLFAGANQVNAMIPFDLPINATHQVVVQRGTAISNPEAVGVVSSQSGVFTKDLSGQGVGIVVRVAADGTQSVVSTDNPAHAYEAVVIYCAGLGDVSPRQIAGQQAGFSPLSQTLDSVTATIGGIDAPVFFAGLTPGFTGLYQVNAYVPTGVAPGGNVQLIITQAGRTSPPVLISVR